MSKLKTEATKFTFVGALNFGLTFVVFTIMLKIIGANYLISLGTSWVFGMLFSYALNFSWVFKQENKICFDARFLKFLTTGLISITLNMLVLSFLVGHSEIDPFYLQILLIPLVVVFNFTATKYWSLR
jgi:putative flippase GtrA